MTRREVWVELIAIARSRDEMGGGAYAAEQEFEEWLQEVREDPDLLAALTEGLNSENKVIRARTCMAWTINYLGLGVFGIWQALPGQRDNSSAAERRSSL